MSSTAGVVKLVLLCGLSMFCGLCFACEPTVAPCNDTRIITHVNTSIKYIGDQKVVATKFFDKYKQFSSNSSAERFRVVMTGSCLRRTRFFVISSMSNGDYMQADRIRYEGHMCTAHYFMTGRGSVLFGMTKTSNQTSNYSVSYLCPTEVILEYARALDNCLPAWGYVSSNPQAFKSLVRFLRTEDFVNEAIGTMKNPGPYMCKIFKLAKETCKLKLFDVTNTEKC